MTVALGVLLPAGGFARAVDVADLARHCEEAGLESIWLAEHAALPAGTTTGYPYAEDGRLPIAVETPLPDPLVWFAAAAGATTTLRFGTAYVAAAPRNPLVLAKQVATLERLTSGRIELGLGVGWCAEELAAGGVGAATATERFEELLAVVRALWAGPADHRGDHWRFSDMVAEPRPATPVPVLIEASSEQDAARAGRLGDGLLARHVDRDRTARLIERMRRSADEAGRPADDLTVSMVVSPEVDLARELELLGVDRAVVLLPPMEPARVPRVVSALAARWNR